MKRKNVVFIGSLFFLLNSCEWLGEYYVGLTLQPETDNSYTAGLNVFGALKVGENLDTINHYFEVEKLIAIKDTTSEITVDSAEIVLTRHLSSGEIETYELSNQGDGLYFNTEIEIEPGETWDYLCIYDTCEVSSSCTIPKLPVLVGGTLAKSKRAISFEIQKDSSAYIYDIYLISGANIYADRVVAQESGNTSITITTDWDIEMETAPLYVFAYDEKFETYFSTSSIFFKPNAYRPSYSVVDGGYGVFGAISSIKIELND